MSEPALAPPTASALRLVVTAERLFALHGIDGVSLRQIAAEAGSGNNSAVHYHFGSKDGLIEAILGHRLAQLTRERQMLVSRCDPDDVRARFEAHYLPVFAMAEEPDNRYVSFVEQLQRREASGSFFTRLPKDWQTSHENFLTEMRSLLEAIDEPMRTMRIADAQTLCLHAAADRERALARGSDVPPFALFVGSLLDGVTGFVTAPTSPGTLRHAGRADAPMAQTLRLL